MLVDNETGTTASEPFRASSITLSGDVATADVRLYVRVTDTNGDEADVATSDAFTAAGTYSLESTHRKLVLKAENGSSGWSAWD